MPIISLKRNKYTQSNFFYKGVTLVEMLVFVFIFSIIALTFYSVWSNGTRYILLAKNRLVANALANEKMEIVRNLAFDDIAHTTGSPAGNLLQNEDIDRDGRLYHILTQIKNVDDPFDGTCQFTGDNDCVAPVDYKFVKITVSWENGTQSIATSSRFVPAGVEQPIPNSGVLVVNVTSDKNGGAAVPNTSIRIYNSANGFDETHSTDLSGQLMLYGVPEAIKQYEVTLTKSGYETVTTFAPYPTGPYNPPVHEHTSVIAEAVNTIDIFQNELAGLTVKTLDYLDNPIADIDFHLAGGRLLGTDPVSLSPVWTTDQDAQTGSAGEEDFGDNLNPGNYIFTLDAGETGYALISADPANRFTVIPGDDAIFSVYLADKIFTSALISVVTVVDGENVPVKGANIRLTNGAYDANDDTTDSGNIFFPINPDNVALLPGTYNLTVTAAGYTTNNSQLNVTSGLSEVTISLVPTI